MIAVLLIFVIRTIKVVLYLSYLYQLKEYRLDRMLIHLKTNQGKKLLFNPLNFFKWFLLAALFVYDTSFITAIIFLVWVFEVSLFLRDINQKKVFLPEFKIRLLGIYFFVFLVFATLMIFSSAIPMLLVLDRFTFIIITIAVQISNYIFDIRKRIIIEKARNKLKNYKNLKIIGITGSYGKSSTKEFLAAILSEKFNTLKNPASINTSIGVAENILRNLKTGCEVLIVEMAAYKKGEIKEICNLVNPSIGIISAIGNQHLSLFGSIKNLRESKFELIQALPPGSLAFFNSDNKESEELIENAKKLGRKVITIGTKAKPLYKATNIIESKFDLSFKVNKESFKINVLGRHNVTNLLLAIAVAKEFGMSNKQINNGLSKIKPISKTMQPIINKNGSVYINDTFNANPQAVFAALDYMKQFKGEKILILQPLIELGINTEEAHEKIGEISASVCDRVYLTNNNYYQNIVKKISMENRHKIILINQNINPTKYITDLGENCVVLFEGKEAEKYLHSVF